MFVLGLLVFFLKDRTFFFGGMGMRGTCNVSVSLELDTR